MNLSVKNVSSDLVVRLRARATRHHRSLQGEVLTILEESLAEPKFSVQEVYERVQRLDFTTPSESAAIIRQERDAR